MTPIALEWVQKADEDFAVAEWVAQGPIGSFSAICFHCQQCIEKYLKARLQEANTPFPKTHDLDVLLNLVVPSEPAWASLRPRLAMLQPFSVETRYPGISASPSDAADALRTCRDVRAILRASMGLS